MQTMISKEATDALKQMGRHLRVLRIDRKDRQSDFAARLGVSIPTLRKLEQGDPSVAIGTWVDAFWLLGRLDDLVKALAPKTSLFDQFEKQSQASTRKRAPKK